MYILVNVCVCVSYTIYVRVCVSMCVRVRACVCVFFYIYVCACARVWVCMHTMCSHCESYNINSMIFFIMKFKIYFEVILISFDEAKFIIDSEQLVFGAHAVRYSLYSVWNSVKWEGIKKMAQGLPSSSWLFCTLSKSSMYIGLMHGHYVYIDHATAPCGSDLLYSRLYSRSRQMRNST